ncbi:Protein of unknown function [Pyronema omphalodes CBS 100304]|uniref:Uncharacterized protein n=1 Tax=Pyronema omphalodes (strain CBS 100304) TaxID=1076935 RepID=U4LT26_PYROM|nr:Protein of unknown function [Pyronema omphalodes CBS 100304]
MNEPSALVPAFCDERQLMLGQPIGPAIFSDCCGAAWAALFPLFNFHWDFPPTQKRGALRIHNLHAASLNHDVCRIGSQLVAGRWWKAGGDGG